MFLQNPLKHQAQWISFSSASHLLDTGVQNVKLFDTQLETCAFQFFTLILSLPSEFIGPYANRDLG